MVQAALKWASTTYRLHEFAHKQDEEVFKHGSKNFMAHKCFLIPFPAATGMARHRIVTSSRVLKLYSWSLQKKPIG